MISPVMPTYARTAIKPVRGEGPWLFDENGDRYLDFASGIAVNALGHAHPKLVQALTDQAKRLWHVSNLYEIPGQEALAERLTELTFADTVFFQNSGAEALECAIKLTRKYHSAAGAPERFRIITFEGCFHGRTLATIAASGAAKMVEGFGPMLDGFDHVPFDDDDALAAAIGPQTAGVLIEPIQGEGGIRPVSPQRLKRLRELCDAHGLLLIFDEVQCGVGRTGKLFAHEWVGVFPDVMAVAKGLGGGFPVGACLSTEEAAKGMTAGTHGSTFGGNPLAMAVAAAMLDAVTEEGFLDNVSRISGAFCQRLEGLVASYPDVLEEVRGEGLMLGLKTKAGPAPLVEAARAHNLLCVPAADGVVRLLPPLNIDETHVAAAIEALDAACSAVSSA